MKLHAYVNFDGKCEEAFRYYEQHLGAKTQSMMKWKEMPGAEQHTPPGMEDKVLHAKLDVADTYIMASDVPGHPDAMRSAYLCVTADSSEDAERMYNALADGGTVFMAMNETFFAHKFGQLRDKFGINWMVIHEKPMH